MSDIWKTFGYGKLINLRRGDDIELAAMRITSFSRQASHGPQDIIDEERISEMRRRETAQRDFEKYRGALMLLPLEMPFRQINRTFVGSNRSGIENYYSEKSISKWNNLIYDFLLMTYGRFTDYLLGYKLDSNGCHVELEPPDPTQAAMIAARLAKMITTLTQPNFFKFLTPTNKNTIRELYEHLRPHMKDGVPLARAMTP